MKLFLSSIGRWLLFAAVVLLSRQAFSVPQNNGTEHGMIIAVTRMDENFPEPLSYTDTVMRWLRQVYINYNNVDVIFICADPASVEKFDELLLSDFPVGSFVIFHGSCTMDDTARCQLGYSTVIKGSWYGNPDPIDHKDVVFDLPLSILESQEPPDILSFMGLSALVSVYYQRAEFNAAGRTCSMALEYTEGVEKEFVNDIEALRSHIMDDRNLAGEVHETDETIALDTDNGDLYMERAVLNAELGNYIEAAGDIERAIELGPYSDSSCVLYSRTILRIIKLSRIDHNSRIQIDTETMSDLEARLDDALTYLETAIRLDSLDAELYFLRSNVYGYLIEWTPAEEDLSRAIELNPAFAEAYAARGNVNIEMGYTDQAISDLTKAIELSPDSASYYETRAFAYQMCGEIEKAEYDIQAASELASH